jgi:hypothetical protein
MFTPVSQMPKALRAHLRYPEDLLTLQSAMYGRYHIIQPLAFYNATNAWSVSPSAGSGSPNQALQRVVTATSQGNIIGQITRMAPEYEVFQQPGQSKQTFNLVDSFVPANKADNIQTMSALIVAGSDPSDYGKLTVYQTPPIDGPALVDSDISATQAISSKISLLNRAGSNVLLGTLQVVPVGDSMLYFRPFYVESSRNPFPKLDYYIVVYAGAEGQSKVAFKPTLQAALKNLFGVSLPGQTNTGGSKPTGPSTSVSATVQALIAQAAQQYEQGLADLKAGDFAAYGVDNSNLQNTLNQLQQQAGTSTISSTTTTTPTKPTKPAKKSSSTTTTVPPGTALGAIRP